MHNPRGTFSKTKHCLCALLSSADTEVSVWSPIIYILLFVQMISCSQHNFCPTTNHSASPRVASQARISGIACTWKNICPGVAFRPECWWTLERTIYTQIGQTNSINSHISYRASASFSAAAASGFYWHTMCFALDNQRHWTPSSEVNTHKVNAFDEWKLSYSVYLFIPGNTLFVLLCHHYRHPD